MYLFNDRKGWLSIRVNYLLLIFFLLSAPIMVKAQASYADFKIPELVCEGLEYEFENTSYLKPGDTATYLWWFEDALSQNTSNGTVQWEHLSEYRNVTAKLTMYLQNGDSSVKSRNVTVLRRPFADLSVNDACEGDKFISINKSKTHQQESVSYDYLGFELDSAGNWPLTGFTRIYNVSLIAAYSNGCSDTTTVPVTVHRTPYAEYTVEILDDLIYKFDGPSGYEIYAWRFGDGTFSSEEDPIHQYSIRQNYYHICLDVKDIAGCWGSHCEGYFPPNLDIIEQNLNGINIYPNPSDGHVKIQSSKELIFKLYDMAGREMNIDKVSFSSEEYKLSFDLIDGVYHLQISDGENQFIKKLIINKNN